MKKAITVLIAALGGEGGGVLAEWLVETATQAGYLAQSTSIPGVAQRTGATTYYVEVYPEPIASLAGRTPVLSLLPVPGCIDLLVASELLEAARTVQSGMASAARTTILTSVSRTLTTAEKMSLGDGRFDSGLLLEVAKQYSKKLLAFDMNATAAGGVVSAVMLGAIAASGALPFSREQFEAVIRASGVGVDTSIAGFDRGWNEIRNGAANGKARSEEKILAVGSGREQIAANFPASTREILDEGYRRSVEFQDRAYADLYLQRLTRVLAAERATGTVEADDFPLTRETGRFLALWMAYDDIVRVADLKCRASRFARVRQEVTAKPGDVVRIYDFFKPGMPEICALLPARLAKILRSWDRRRQARGKLPFAIPLRIPTHGVFGFALLHVLAGMRGLRRRGARYAEEQGLIENWLAAIESAAMKDSSLASEISLCGRLIKGYGATNERGKANLAHILGQLASGGAFATTAERAAAIRMAREAALADEGGKALDQVLVAHGASARSVQAQPIRWSKRATIRAGADA